MITKNRVTEIFCIIDDYHNCIRGCFHKEFPMRYPIIAL